MEKISKLEEYIDTYDIGGMTRTELMSKINTMIVNARANGYDEGYVEGQCEPDEDAVTDAVIDRAMAMRGY